MTLTGKMYSTHDLHRCFYVSWCQLMYCLWSLRGESEFGSRLQNQVLVTMNEPFAL